MNMPYKFLCKKYKAVIHLLKSSQYLSIQKKIINSKYWFMIHNDDPLTDKMKMHPCKRKRVYCVVSQ